MTRDYDAEAKDTPQHQYAYDFDYRMHHYLVRTFSGFFTSGNALELGCYHGHFTRLLCERFEQVHVVEASAECIAEAGVAVGQRARFFQRRFEDFTPDQQYDNIFLVHTLEHLDDRVGMLARIGSWLREGGRLFVATPNARAGSRQIAVKMGLIEHNAAVTAAESAHGHRVTYSLDTLGADVQAAGLRTLWQGGVFFKGLANFQLDAALKAKIISDEYLNACYELGKLYPDLCSSIYCVCVKTAA
jgi:2-polyprenyl-3-methyl-5-hydroxy-6-metoxy-1,4-benzoquinol methylase